MDIRDPTKNIMLRALAYNFTKVGDNYSQC